MNRQPPPIRPENALPENQKTLDETLVGSHIHRLNRHLDNAAGASDSGDTLLDPRTGEYGREYDGMAVDFAIDASGHIEDSGVKPRSSQEQLKKASGSGSKAKFRAKGFRLGRTVKIALWSHLVTVLAGMLLYGVFLFNL